MEGQAREKMTDRHGGHANKKKLIDIVAKADRRLTTQR